MEENNQTGIPQPVSSNATENSPQSFVNTNGKSGFNLGRFFNRKTFGLLVILILVAVVPLVVMVSQQQQEIRQRASETTIAGPCSDHLNDCNFDTRTWATIGSETWESVTAYGKYWNWNTADYSPRVSGFLGQVTRYARSTGPCFANPTACRFDTRTFATLNDGTVWESITVNGKYWNYSTTTKESDNDYRLENSGNLYDVRRYKDGPCLDHPTDCKFDARTFRKADGATFNIESVTAYGRLWEWNSSNNNSPINDNFGTDLTSITPLNPDLRSKPDYKNGPCQGKPLPSCTLDTRIFVPVNGEMWESVTAYGKYWNWSYNVQGGITLRSSGDISKVARYAYTPSAPTATSIIPTNTPNTPTTIYCMQVERYARNPNNPNECQLLTDSCATPPAGWTISDDDPCPSLLTPQPTAPITPGATFTPIPTHTPTPTQQPNNYSILGTVYLDSNGNGQKDSNENAAPIGTPSIDVIDSTTSYAVTRVNNGTYHSDNLSPKQYWLTFIVPTGYKLTGRNISISTPDSGTCYTVAAAWTAIPLSECAGGKKFRITFNVASSNATVNFGIQPLPTATTIPTATSIPPTATSIPAATATSVPATATSIPATPTSNALAADVDQNGCISINDFNAWLYAFWHNGTPTDTRFRPDMNGDRQVTLEDYNVWFSAYRAGQNLCQ